MRALRIVVPEGLSGRLDRALADAAPDLSRSRIQALLTAGAISRAGQTVGDGAQRAIGGEYLIELPDPVAAGPIGEELPLDILFEDDHLIVIDKAAGMPTHPAPGAHSGTLVNALLHHCGASLSGIGGVARPGIVHRLDKLTSGVMVAAKTDIAHRRLSALFAAHAMERVYVALTRGSPRSATGVIETQLGRSPFDRKKMAVLRRGGRRAVTSFRVERSFGPPAKPLGARIACTLETGRTHQIRVHLAHAGAPCLGDPLYGSGPAAFAVRLAVAAAGLNRQALHARTLGLRHPITGEALRFDTPPPPDMQRLESALAAL